MDSKLETASSSDCGRQSSRCAACGSSFPCGAMDNACWCSEIKVTEETRAELGRLYEGCLCQPCLEAAASRQKSL